MNIDRRNFLQAVACAVVAGPAALTATNGIAGTRSRKSPPTKELIIWQGESIVIDQEYDNILMYGGRIQTDSESRVVRNLTIDVGATVILGCGVYSNILFRNLPASFSITS